MKFVYPAIIHNDPDGLWAEFPNLPGCQTYAETLDELLDSLKEAMECHIVEALEHGDKLEAPSDMTSLPHTNDEYATLVAIDANLARNTKSVRKTVTIPAWIDKKARTLGLNFSQTLQDALVAKFA